MTGCDRCGAQALASEAACPVCGLELRRSGVPLPGSTPQIPVRRHGTMPHPPMEMMGGRDDTGAVGLMAFGLGGLGAALIAAGIGYWLW
ncbi:MAG: hypothetical protein EOO24_67455 [Comamonadaceae bacterium]|nr:MAG: hypothetical protein EOO24_67455 [Comamonadaceae bacterium]